MDIEDRILALRGEIEILQQEITRLSGEVQNTCTHRYSIAHGWVSDDGYGRLKTRIGKFCRSCGAFDYWQDGKWGKLGE